MKNTSPLFVKVVLSLVTAGSLVVTVAGPIGATEAGAAVQTTTTTPATTPSGHSQVSPHLRVCRALRADLAIYSKGLSRYAAQVGKIKAHAAKVQPPGHVKGAQARQRVATKFEARLARRQAALAKRSAAFARRDAKYGVTC